MKKTLWILSALFFINSTSMAQELPMPSPEATLKQRIGLTDVTIRYSRPSAKGRIIFGDLVPFNELWRAGANMCTRISFSTDVQVGDTKVKAGTYAILYIPGTPEWTFIMNTDTTLRGTSGYDSLKDVLRMNVPSMGNPEMKETMSFDFDFIRDTEAVLVMSWADQNVKVPIMVNNHEQAMKNIKEAIKNMKEGEYRPHMNAASYLNRVGESEAALGHINKAIEIGNYWYAHWIKGQILAKLERFKEATEAGDKALLLGAEAYAKEGRVFTYVETFAPELESWRQRQK